MLDKLSDRLLMGLVFDVSDAARSATELAKEIGRIRDQTFAIAAETGLTEPTPGKSKLWLIPPAIVALVVICSSLPYADAGPLWSSLHRQEIYLKNPPEFSERVAIELDGKIYVKVYQRVHEKILREVSSREITEDQAESENARIVANIKRGVLINDNGRNEKDHP